MGILIIDRYIKMVLELTDSQRLIKFGFATKTYEKLKQKRKPEDMSDSEAVKYAEQEFAEEVNMSSPSTMNSGDIIAYMPTGYPPPVKRYRLIYEAFGLSIEETYFWILGHVRQDQAYPSVDKITDIFSASENSAFWGQSAQRLGLQQDKIANYLALIGKFIKELFQLVREIRILKERLSHYYDSMKVGRSSESAEITLKGYWIDLVEGGAKNPASVYGMTAQVGFTTLPDLFFGITVINVDNIDTIVDKLDFNRKVKEVLKRKLRQFGVWKQKTFEELRTRERFTLKYLRQHWNIVKMYMSWVKPYLRSVKRLSMNERQIASPDIITAFETSILEMEFLAKKPVEDGYHPVILATFKYTTKPTLSFQQDGYGNRGPLHVGRAEVNLRAYSWNDDQIKNYKAMKEQEDMELLGLVDGSIRAAMEALGEELENYLREAEEKIEPSKKEDDNFKPPRMNVFEPFIDVFKGFGEILGAFNPFVFIENDKKKSKGDKKKAEGVARGTLWQLYKNYKKSHGMLSW